MLNHIDWIYIQNPFEASLGKSYQKTEIFTLDHIAQLSARRHDELRLEGLVGETQQKYNSFSGSYTQWRQVNKNYNLATARMEEELGQLVGEGSLVESWDLRVQLSYRKHTLPYKKELFPQGRKPFNGSAKDLRIRAVGDLAKAMTQFPELSNVQKEVHDFHLQLAQFRHEQQQLEQQVKHSATLLRKAKKNLIQQLCYNKDMLLVIFRYQRTEILNFFAMNMLRTKVKNKIVEATTTDEVMTDGDAVSEVPVEAVDDLIAVPNMDQYDVVVDEEPREI